MANRLRETLIPKNLNVKFLRMSILKVNLACHLFMQRIILSKTLCVVSVSHVDWQKY